MAVDSFKRKLAAIMSADVKGYSRLTSDNETETVKTLTASGAWISVLAVSGEWKRAP